MNQIAYDDADSTRSTSWRCCAAPTATAQRLRHLDGRQLLDGDPVSEGKRHPDVGALMDRPSRPRLSERTTRAKAAPWDRVKFVVLLGILWLAGLAVVWTTTVKPIGGPFSDAVRIAVHDYVWIVILMALEVAPPAPLLDRGAFPRLLPLLAEDRVRRGEPGPRYDGRLDPVPRRTRREVRPRAVRTEHAPGPHLQHRPRVAGHRGGPVAARRGVTVRVPAGCSASSSIVVQFVGLFWFLSRGGIDTSCPTTSRPGSTT